MAQTAAAAQSAQASQAAMAAAQQVAAQQTLTKAATDAANAATTAMGLMGALGMPLLQKHPPEVLFVKVRWEILQNSQENTCARVFFNFIKNETLAQVFSCEFYKIS